METRTKIKEGKNLFQCNNYASIPFIQAHGLYNNSTNLTNTSSLPAHPVHQSQKEFGTDRSSQEEVSIC